MNKVQFKPPKIYLDIPELTAALNKTLDEWYDKLTPKQKRQLRRELNDKRNS